MSYSVLLRGPLGVGKSTVAERLAARIGGRAISIDQILEEHSLEEWDADRISLRSFLRANDRAVELARGSLGRGVPVVIEGNFYWREAITDLARRLKGPLCVYTLDAPLEVCIARDAARPRPAPGKVPRPGESMGDEAARQVYRMVARIRVGTRVDARAPVETVVERIAGTLPAPAEPTAAARSRSQGGRRSPTARRTAVVQPRIVRPGDPGSEVRLEPMSAPELRESVERGIVRSARENIARGLWSRALARTTSRSEYAELLPQGGKTPGFCFFTIVDRRTGRRVGETWYSVRRKGGKTHFWVHWILVDPRYRRRGYARATLEELARRARAAGADRVGLHVLADNAAARSLYAKLGYAPTSLRLAKKL